MPSLDIPPGAEPLREAPPERADADPRVGAADVTTPRGDVLDRAAEAALELAAERPWDEVSLRDIARASGVGFAELYALTPGKDALLDRLSRRMDEAALESGEDDAAGDVHDRLFEATMARLEALQPHRAAFIAIARARGPAPLLPVLPRTARALLEAAGIDTSGWKGALRVAGMTRVWVRTLQVWRDDEGALNRTMAEIDRRLRDLRSRLRRVGAGF